MIGMWSQRPVGLHGLDLIDTTLNELTLLPEIQEPAR